MSIFIKRIKFQFTVSVCFSWHLFLRLGRFVCITVANKWSCFKSAHWVVCGLFSWGFLSQLIPYRWWLIGRGKIWEAQSYLLMQILTFSMNHLSSGIQQPNPYLPRQRRGCTSTCELELTSFFLLFFFLFFLGGGDKRVGKEGSRARSFLFFSQSDNSECNQMESLNGKYVYKSKWSLCLMNLLETKVLLKLCMSPFCAILDGVCVCLFDRTRLVSLCSSASVVF